MEGIPVFVFNTESRKKKNYKKYKTFFFLASGFKDLYILSDVNLEGVNLIYYDFNPFAIEFKQWLFESWNGKQESLYKKICKEEYLYTFTDLGYSSKKDFQKLTREEQYQYSWNVELDNWNDMNHFQETFKRVQQHINKRFVSLDISKDFKKLFELVSSEVEPIYFWFSNCFNFEHNKTTNGSKIQFKSVIKKTGKDITCVQT